MTKKRKMIYITIAAIIIIAAALAIIFMPKTAPQTVTEMLSTAQKYLVEMEYERAIAEFNKVIELDPMNADAYLGLAEAYEKSGDIDKAIETLKNGFELTGDERLQARLALLNRENADNAEVSETMTAVEPEKVKYVNVQGFEIPTNITELYLIGPDIPYESGSSAETDEGKHIYRLEEPLSDISFLIDFKELKKLNLELNNLTDISVLSNLKNINELWLGINQISDVSPLAELSNLKTLHISSNKISDASGLYGMTNLRSLDIIHYNQLSEADIESLKEALPYCSIY